MSTQHTAFNAGDVEEGGIQSKVYIFENQNF